MAELQEAVGGYFEFVTVWGGIMAVDEEGLLKDEVVVNVKASQLAGKPIVGDVLLMKPDDVD